MRHIRRPLRQLAIAALFAVLLAAYPLPAFAADGPAAALNSPAAMAVPAPKADKAEKAKPKASGEEGVSFNFVDVDIVKVAEFISDLTGKNFIYDSRVKGNVTIIAPSKLKKGEAYNLFTSVLQLKGYAMVPSGVNAFKIVPAAELKQSGLKVSSTHRPINEDYIVRIINFENISADSALKFLQPLISKSGYISSFGPGNMLLVIDSGINLKKLLSIVKTIDLPSHHEEPEVVYLKNSLATSMVTMLNQGKPARVARKGAQPASATKAVADKRLNAVVLFGSKSDKDAMKRLISMLDEPSSEEQGSINVYFLENADANDMAKVLQGLVSAAKGSQTKAPKRPGTPSAATRVSPFQSASGLTITPDSATNSLVIIGSPSDYASLVAIIKQLDRRRKQVYVEAMIVEASIDNLRELGSKWRGAATHNGDPVVIGGVGSVDTSTMQEIITGLTGGLSLGGTTNYMDMDVLVTDSSGLPTNKTLTIPGFAALFSLSEFAGSVNILSSPQILTADNTEAEIVVGENVPFVTQTETTTTTNPIKSIERKDVGISMKLTPQITEGDYVKLDLYQEISSVKESSEKIITEVGPTTSKRSTKTTVIVKDNHTVVISGLMEEREVESETRVPLLHRIPLLGWLFKFRSRGKVKTNLLVFLTPHIVRDAEEMQQLTAQKTDAYAKDENTYIEGELLVKFNPDVSHERALELIEKMRATLIKQLAEGLYYVKLSRKHNVRGGIKAFSKLKEVEYAEPNYRIKSLREIESLKSTSADVASPARTGSSDEAQKSPSTPDANPVPKGPPSWLEDTENGAEFSEEEAPMETEPVEPTEPMEPSYESIPELREVPEMPENTEPDL